MKKNKLYKYINLLLRIIIGVAAVWFIYIKLKDDFILKFQEINLAEIDYKLVIAAMLLLFINWGLEAAKWKYAIRKVENITFAKSFKLTITGITIGLITPNRIGEIPARALLLNKDSFRELTLRTIVSSFSQLLITLMVGTIGFIVVDQIFVLNMGATVVKIVLFLASFIFLLLYFKVNKLEPLMNKIKYFREKELFKGLLEFSFSELVNMLIYSLLRYVVFAIQFWLVLSAFGVVLHSVEDVLLIPVCFMLASFIPTILISEIGVRGSVALFVFGTVSDMNIQIILASMLLWVINVALPAVLGLINLNEFKLLKQK